MNRKQIIIVGSNFAGYTAALELYDRLGRSHDITVIDRKTHFLFMPSLIWVPFGLREEEDITFDVRPAYDERGIRFVQTEVIEFDLEHRVVRAFAGDYSYDYLVVATGPKPDYDYIPGLREYSHSILGYEPARKAGEAWKELLKNPGPMVVIAPQGAACFGAAYEFLFNARHQIGKHGLHKEIPLTYISAEPFPSHFGIGGFANGEFLTKAFFKVDEIDSRFNTAVQEICADGVVLADGEFIPSAYTMAMPRFLGVDAVRHSPGLANESGWIEVDAGYRHKTYPEVFAAGVAVQVDPPEETEIPCGVPKTGFPSEEMAKVVAHNITVAIEGGEIETLEYGDIPALCIMDAGNMGMMIIGDKMLPNRRFQVILPGPQAHWAKLGFERYFMRNLRRSVVPKKVLT